MSITSLLVALWGMYRGRKLHSKSGPLVVTALSAIAMVAGVVFIHGFPAIQLIWSAVVGLLAATTWNVVSRRECM